MSKLGEVSDEAAASIHVPPSRAAELIDSGEVEVVDVRRDWEWEAGHLPELSGAGVDADLGQVGLNVDSHCESL